MTTALTEKPQYLVDLVRWEQNVKVRDYESAKCTVEVSFLTDPDGDAESQIALIDDTIERIKARVENALGIKDHESTAVELIDREFPGTRQVAQPPPMQQYSAEPDSSIGVPAEPPHNPLPLAKPRPNMTELEKAQAKENEAWAAARLRLFPDEFYDNRESKAMPGGNPNWPDFKHKVYKIGVYVR